MRTVIAAMFVLALAACGQASAPAEAPPDASAGSTGVGIVPEEAFTLEPEALVGLWSFERDCGLYDLVFDADDLAQYYDYTSTPPVVISHRGSWATADNNRVVLTVSVLDADGEPTAERRTFHLDVTAPVTDDLIGVFGPEGGPAREITARRCEDEDRE
ncbi:MAG: hypothetical protein K2X34_06420 [Hyphomonadaceae bacterium]|nr:hypothetical protein [Hyphomonadaceae bacterium]